jgi:thiol-disulfide isomerase/thioredoxin
MTRRAHVKAGYSLDAHLWQRVSPSAGASARVCARLLRCCQPKSGNIGQWKLPALVCALSVSCIAAAQPAPSPVGLACRWSAQLTVARPGVSDSYLVPFDLLIERTPAGLRAALLNGGDRIDFSSIDFSTNASSPNTQQGNQVTLRLDQYDATLSARCSAGQAHCDALEGEYVRQKGASLLHYAFRAQCPPASASPEPVSAAVPQLSPQSSNTSDWQFAFTDSSGKPDSEPNAPAHFTQQANHVEGTIAPISGDYGALAGEIVGDKSGGNDAVLHLSRFDGIHALRLDGRLVAPGRIEGVFHVAPEVALNYVATATGASSGFEEAERLTSVANPSEPFRFHGADASGVIITQSDPRFRGKVVLLDIFGTWCPNCHDEAPVLQSLYAQFHSRGLEIVGLSYEYTGDRARSRRLLQIYRRKYSIAFPLLLAGTTDFGQIGKTLPQLRNFGAYPTTIFLDRHGRVRLIHAGFSGPATGRLEEVKQSFQQTIVKLLDER